MKITKREKVNICYIFLALYENIRVFLTPFYNSLNEQFRKRKGNDNLFDLKFKEKYKDYDKKQSLKTNEIHEILEEIDLLTSNDKDKLKELSEIRDNIAHNTLNLYFDKNIEFEYFKLDELVDLYKNIFKKICEETISDNPDFASKALQVYNYNILEMATLISELMRNSKFDNFKKKLKEKINEI